MTQKIKTAIGSSNGQNPTSYDFATQLELGELLLGLGRVKEAEIELRKAQQLVEIEGIPTQSPANITRLTGALSQVEGLSNSDESRSRLLWTAAAAFFFLLFAGTFLLWIFSRANSVQNEADSIKAAAAVSVRETEAAKTVFLANLENTRTVREIVNQSHLISTISADNTRIAGIAGSQSALATAEFQSETLAIMATRESAQAAATVQSLILAQSSATPTLRPTRTPPATTTPSVPIYDRFRIKVNGSNVRRGPDLGYPVISVLPRDDIVNLLAKAPDVNWYNVQTVDGAIGWIHASLIEPLALSDVPLAETVPAPPPATVNPTLTMPASPPPPTSTPTIEAEG